MASSKAKSKANEAEVVTCVQLLLACHERPKARQRTHAETKRKRERKRKWCFWFSLFVVSQTNEIFIFVLFVL